MTTSAYHQLDRDGSDQTSGRVVVGVDGSPASIDALHWARRYATLTGSRLEAVSALSVPTGLRAYGTAYDAVEVNWVDTATRILDVALAEAFPEGSEFVTRSIAWSHPAKALIKVSAGADLLVVGSRGHGGFFGMLLGSVSAHVTAHAPCPVLVVRQGQVATATEEGNAAGNVASEPNSGD